MSVGRALVEAGRRVSEIVRAIAKWSGTAMKNVFKGLRLAGRKLAEVVREVARQTGAALRKMVTALYQAFGQAAEILVAFAKALLGLGRTDQARGVLSSLEAMGYAAPELIALREAAGISAP